MNGSSLVELLVALAVGAIVALFAASLLAGANGSLAAQAEAAVLDDTGNYVLATVGRAVRQGGWGLTKEPGLSGGGTELIVTYAGVPDGSMLNCAGAAEEGPRGWSVFRLDGEALRCRYKSGHSWSAQTMASGVRDLRLAYGVDTDMPFDGIANQWVETTEETPGRVVAVRMSFVLEGRYGPQRFAQTFYTENAP